MFLFINRRVRKPLAKGLSVVTVMLLIYFVFGDLLDEPLTAQGLLKFSQQNIRNIPKPFLVQPAVTCKRHTARSTVIIVISKMSNYLQQETIRKTWGNPKMQMEYNFNLYFLIGTVDVSNRDYKREVHDDIIQVDVTENYFNLTDKTVAAFNWVTHFCQEASYFIKVDDDIYLDLETLREMQTNEDYLPENVILGSCFNTRSPHRISTKWKISYEEYPFKTYPPYCSGAAYAMTYQTALKIHREMRETKHVKLEDIYIAIVVARLGMAVKNEDCFLYDFNPFMLDNWLLKDFYIRCHRVTHYITPETVEELWDKKNTIGRKRNDCSFWGKTKYLLSYLL